MLRAILIDDEELALAVLEILLLEIGGVTVVGKFLGISEALEQCADLQPDLIFLDIEMPGTNGLEAAESLLAQCSAAEIIYVTAHHQYAVEAFEANAIGYLLKPVAKDRLAKAVSRYVYLHARDAKRNGELPGKDGKDAGHAGSGKLSLKVLGSMELYNADGRLITWRTKKTKEMFAYLWHHGGTPVYRYHLIDHLWPDTAPDRAQTLFHTTLYNLRKALKSAGCPDMVVFGDERYWMRTERIASDYERLEQLMKKGCQPGDAEELFALYRGDYLEIEHYEWANSRIYDIRTTYVQCLEQALEGASGSVRERLLRKLIELEPYQEKHYDRLKQHLGN
ncbi:hypothetical protein SD70_00755 [Gordoniibacillus kamchatkensis]|uniref:Response regulatory domain-containing protein n=1 Tax=Gordoniibacillus kamchatkensis TaxID=1590651 RepID=A0ABR5ANP8_9BACL|nr:response regulator [Paenibacillus sp. VKM B-2647]KIL42468.1 hypothetical protein SD70_00755 [Paenibacillus sp. VKM B-2647]